MDPLNQFSKIAEILKASQKKKYKILVFGCSPRSEKTCPGEDGKSNILAQEAIEKYSKKNVDFEYFDLSVNPDEPAVQACKGCVSTANGYHCAFPCSCYHPDRSEYWLENDYMFKHKIYDKMQQADAFVFYVPVNWYAPPTNLKAFMDRLTCIQMTLTYEDQFYNLKIGKDPKKTRALEKSGDKVHLLKNHLKGKVCAFFAHGDAGAADYMYEEKPFIPEALKENPEPKEASSPLRAILPLIWQFRYSGVEVPDVLVKSVVINKGYKYSEGNDRFQEDLEHFHYLGHNLLEEVVGYLESQS